MKREEYGPVGDFEKQGALLYAEPHGTRLVPESLRRDTRSLRSRAMVLLVSPSQEDPELFGTVCEIGCAQGPC